MSNLNLGESADMSQSGAYPDTYKDRIIDAALRLAVSRPWSEISLREIAQAAGSNLVELRGSFSSKADIIAAFTRRIDDEVLTKIPPMEKGQSHRDALFEVLMTRFDALQPHKEAVRSIMNGVGLEPSLLAPSLASQSWMLQAAGINTDGARGSLRVAGLATLYASVLRTWLEDDDPGLARTMAVLDRRLRRGERALETVEDAAGFVGRVGGIFRSAMRRKDKSGREHETSAPPAGTAPQPPQPEAP